MKSIRVEVYCLLFLLILTNGFGRLGFDSHANDLKLWEYLRAQIGTNFFPRKDLYQFLSHLFFVQIKSYINPSVKPITKKKKKVNKAAAFERRQGGESGDGTCESSQNSSEHTYFSGLHSPAPRLLLTPLQANGPRDIAKFTHLDGGPLGRFLASVPRFSLPHFSTLLN